MQPRLSYIRVEAGQYSSGQQKELLKTMLTVNRGTEIILAVPLPLTLMTGLILQD